MGIIEIDGLTKDYGGKGIFDVSFSIDRGEAFGFLGPNGAGKTTTIRHLMGFIRPQSGTCSIDGMNCMAQAAEIQRTLGYIPGESAFIEEMTGAALIRFMAAYRGMKDLTRAKELTKRFELDTSGKIKRMSKGMKQKMAIVCAFMHDPSVLILDEPTSGLDPLMQNRFIELILSEKARGKTILMSSHMFEEVERTCDRVGMIRQGRLFSVSSVRALKESKRRLYVVTLEDESEAADFAREELTVISRERERVTVAVQQDMQSFVRAMSLHHVVALDVVTQSLEDIFMQYYGSD